MTYWYIPAQASIEIFPPLSVLLVAHKSGQEKGGSLCLCHSCVKFIAEPLRRYFDTSHQVDWTDV